MHARTRPSAASPRPPPQSVADGTAAGGGPKAVLSTDPAHLGITPRAIKRLFDAAAAKGASTGLAYSFTVSYVQIYKETVYDLLNPAVNRGAPQQGGGAAGTSGFRANPRAGTFGGGGTLPPGLRMRWSRGEEFYLEGVWTAECTTAEQVGCYMPHSRRASSDW